MCSFAQESLLLVCDLLVGGPIEGVNRQTAMKFTGDESVDECDASNQSTLCPPIGG